METVDLELLRHEKDTFFSSDRHSPLTPQQQRQFDGLRYYDPNPDLILDLEFERLAHEPPIMMQTSTGGAAQYLRFGRVRFEVDGESASLTIYAAPSGGSYFVPFADATSGDETYGAGRYLDLEPPSGGRFHVNFNLAYNPYCAYNVNWSCPIPPQENRLKVPIRAGERNPSEAWAESY